MRYIQTLSCSVAAAAVIGCSVFSTGCLGTEEDAALMAAFAVEDDPVLGILGTPCDPRGSGGTNGLDSLSFHLYKYTIHSSMSDDLAHFVPFLGWKIQSTSANQSLLINLLQGRETLRYAVRCALGSGDSVWGGTPSETFPGQGLLTTTTGWKTAPLNTAQKEDLFSCLLVHLNALGVEVPISLSGPSVYNSPTFDDTPYDFDEALWTTAITYDTGGSPDLHFYVWPSQQLEDLCLLDLAGVLDLRLCGSFLGLCNLTVRTDKATACSETPNGWKCDGRPAIHTKLQTTDLPLLYGICL